MGWGWGSEGTSDRERDRVGSRRSLKPPLLPLLPSPKEGRICQGRVESAKGGFPGRLETRQGSHPCHSLEERLPQGLELRALPHLPPAAATASG